MNPITQLKSDLAKLKLAGEQANCRHYFERKGKAMHCVHCNLLAEF